MKSMETYSAKWGFVGLLCVDCLAFFSSAFWRRKAYNVFLTTHTISFTLFLPAVCSSPITDPPGTNFARIGFPRHGSTSPS